jgi:hypothetical protein
MKVYAQFIEPDLSGTLAPVCGSDAVAVLDGRYGLERLAAEARRICLLRGYSGFTIIRGSRFGQGQPVYEEV